MSTSTGTASRGDARGPWGRGKKCVAAQCREPCTVKGSIGFVGSESLTIGQSKLLEPMNDEQFMIEARKALEAKAQKRRTK